jgi:hypothetical protein
MDDVRIVAAVFSQSMNGGMGGFACGYCGSSTHWIATNSHTGCTNCGTLVTEECAAQMDELQL